MSQQALGINEVWNSVALEERIELVARAKAEGIVVALGFVLMIGAIAYGFDQIWLLAIGCVIAVLIAPFVASHSWRRNKAEAILSYLAVRSVARRYAYGYQVADFQTVLSFRAEMQDVYASEEERHQAWARRQVDFDSELGSRQPVWVCLMRGAVAILSERDGGAKLEFISPITDRLVSRKAKKEEELPERAVVLEGVGPAQGRTISIVSSYPGALYVFERKLSRLIKEISPEQPLLAVPSK